MLVGGLTESDASIGAWRYQVCFNRHHRRKLQTAGVWESLSSSGPWLIIITYLLPATRCFTNKSVNQYVYWCSYLSFRTLNISAVIRWTAFIVHGILHFVATHSFVIQKQGTWKISKIHGAVRSRCCGLDEVAVSARGQLFCCDFRS